MASWCSRFEEVIAEVEGQRSPTSIRLEELCRTILDQILNDIITSKEIEPYEDDLRQRFETAVKNLADVPVN